MSAVNTLKKIADASVGNLNKGAKYLLERIDPGNKNLFLLLLYPKPVDAFSLGSLADIAFDALIATVYIRSLDISFLSFEYEAQAELKSPKKINFPDTVNISMLEDELGMVGNYLYKWANSIAFPVDESDSTSSVSRVNYVFTDKQEHAKKNCLLIPQAGFGLPSLRYIKMYGLKYQGIENITYGHGEADPLMYNVSCAVDSTWFAPLF